MRCVVVDGGCGVNDRFCGGNLLWVTDHFDNVSWHGVCKMRWWWMQWVKAMVVVMVTIPGGSCGRAGS